MKLSDRQIGYLTFISLALFALGIVLLMVQKDGKAQNTWVVNFPELGSLQPEDDVTMKGFVVGRVADTRWGGEQAEVEIFLFEPLMLHEGIRIVNENYSPMGERRIAIYDPNDGAVLSPGTRLEGTFEPGIAEVMHMMDVVKEQVSMIHQVMRTMRDGDSTQAPLHQDLGDMLDRTNEFLDNTGKAVRQAQPQVRQVLQRVRQTSERVEDLAIQSDSVLNWLYSEANTTMDSLQVGILALHSHAKGMHTLLTEFENSPYHRELLEKKELIEKVGKAMEVLDGILRFASSDGMQITDSLGNKKPLVSLKNIHLFRPQARKKLKKNP